LPKSVDEYIGAWLVGAFFLFFFAVISWATLFSLYHTVRFLGFGCIKMLKYLKKGTATLHKKIYTHLEYHNSSAYWEKRMDALNKSIERALRI
ncbi:hypothetical protein LCGC14_3091580, partial [marine sediment metagenome]